MGRLGGPADGGAEKLFPQFPPFAELQEGAIAGIVEPQLPWTRLGIGLGVTSLPGGGGKQLAQALGAASQLLWAGEQQPPGGGGIEHMVAVGGAGLG